MTYEKEIPEYAMVPAKEMEERVITPVSKEAVYTAVQVSNITEKPKTVITIEEDILVPDTKPDLSKAHRIRRAAKSARSAKERTTSAFPATSSCRRCICRKSRKAGNR